MKSPTTTHRDVACTVCGCVCDDLTLRVSGGKVMDVENACVLAQPWFASLGAHQPPVAAVRGRAVPLDEALVTAGEILNASRAPLIFGLSRSSTDGQRSAVRLADRLGATVDTTASICHGPSIMAIQQVGESCCSLGEVRNRGDLIIYWGADPVESHPRHMERYALEPKGMLVPRGRPDRHLVVVDVCETSSSRVADRFIKVPPDSDFEIIWAIRQLLQGIPLPSWFEVGVPHQTLKDLAALMLSCRYGAVFFGLGLAQQGVGHANVTALLSMVTELNAFTRFTARRLRIPGDVTGADTVLCWQTGFPFAVNLARGYPRYNPGEYTANELLERHEVDACLLVGSESVPGLSRRAQDALSRIPTIAIDYPNQAPTVRADVQFTSAIYGIHAPGTAYRMDEVPVPLRGLMPSTYPRDDQILDRLREHIYCP